MALTNISLHFFIIAIYSRNSTNGQLSTTAIFFVPADSPYIDSFLNLSRTTTATEMCPQLPK